MIASLMHCNRTRTVTIAAPHSTARFPGALRMSLRITLLPALLFSAACSKDVQGPGSEDFRGEWRLFESVEGTTVPIACQARGTLTMAPAQRGIEGTVDAVGECSVSDIRGEHVRRASLQNGSTNGPSIRFTAEPCEYTGRREYYGGVGGTVTCKLNLGGRSETLRGHWTAIPEGFTPPQGS